MVGAPVVGPTDLFLLSTTTTFSTDTSAWVEATPSTFATRSASAAGTVWTAPVGTDDLRSSFGSTVTSAEVEANSRSKVRVTVSEKIRLPATNATDSRTASADSSSRPLWARKLLSVALSTGSVLLGGAVAVERPAGDVETLHPLQHGLRRGPLHLVHYPPVGEEEHQVGVAGGAGVVGHHDHGLSE